MTAAGLPVPPGFVVSRRGRSRRPSTRERLRALARAGDHAGAQELVLGAEPAATRGRRRLRAARRRARRGPLVGVRRGLRGRELRRPAGDVPERRGSGGGAAARSSSAGRRSSASVRSSTASERDRSTISRMAVVVQQMVAPEKSGVLFTVDPVQRRRDRMVVEAVFGLGEQVVSGEVTPDHYVVDRERLRQARAARERRRARSPSELTIARGARLRAPGATSAARRTSSGRSRAGSSTCSSRAR